MVMKFLSKNNKAHIGFDITSDGIIGSVLTKEKGKTLLKNIVFKSFDEEVVQNGALINPEKFEAVLQEIKSEFGFETGAVSLSLPGSSYFVKTIAMPSISMDELKIIIPQEAQKHLPYTLDEVNYDFEVVRKIQDQTGVSQGIEVIITAIVKSIAKNYVDILYKVGFDVVSIDLPSFAAIRTLANTGLLDESDTLAMSVLISDESTDINIIHKGMPVFFNTTPVGKKNVIDSIAANMEIKESEAQKLVQDIALIVPGMELNSDLDPYITKAAHAARTVYNSISNEVVKTMEFYYSQNTDSTPIDKIILSGSGVCVHNIDKFIANRTKINTTLCNSVFNVELPESEDDKEPLEIVSLLESAADVQSSSFLKIPAFATSVGLALKGQ